MSKYRIKLDGKVYEMEIEKVEPEDVVVKSGPLTDKAWKSSGTSKPFVQVINPSVEQKIEKNDHSVKSPMPGTIIKILCTVGESVKKGQSLAILEAMKMENEIVATKSGVIKEMLVSEGNSVPGGAVLFEIGKSDE